MSIGKLRKGEKIIVMRVSEPIQEMYDKMDKVGEELRWMKDELVQLSKMEVEIPDEKLAAAAKKFSELEFLRNQFWSTVNEQYNLWHVPDIGIRDGYCIVKQRGLPDPKEFGKKLKRFLKEELGDTYGIAGPGIEEDDEEE